MAEWLGSALQKLLQRFESASDLIDQKESPVIIAIAGLFSFFDDDLLIYQNELNGLAKTRGKECTTAFTVRNVFVNDLNSASHTSLRSTVDFLTIR